MIYNIEQGTEEWFKVRRGKFTASMFGKLMSSETTKGYNDLINQVVYERLTDQTIDAYVNDAMIRGSELEPEARNDYEFLTGNKVEQIGFVSLDEWVGVSPDGLVGADGLLEIKCPKWNTHIDYLLDDKLPSIYKWQIQGQLYVTDRKWVDFYSYHPSLSPLLIRVERDEKAIDKLKQKLDKAIKEVDKRLNKLKEK